MKLYSTNNVYNLPGIFVGIMMKQYNFPDDLQIKQRRGITNTVWLDEIKSEFQQHNSIEKKQLESTYNIKLIYLDKCEFKNSKIYLKFREAFDEFYDNMVLFLKQRSQFYIIDISLMELSKAITSSKAISYVIIKPQMIAKIFNK